MNNKEENEIKAEIVVLERYTKETKDRLESLHQRLAEAEKLEKLDKLLEKPKLRHGDYGSYKSGNGWIVLYRNEPFLETFGYKSGAGSNAEGDDGLTNVLGNVFDLMKDWDKDWEATWHSKDSQSGKGTSVTIDIDRAKTAIWFGSCGGSAWYAPDVIYEIWHALGHAIAELKRNKEISGEKERKL